MVDQLQKSVREVHPTVTWKEGKLTESIDLVTHVVSLGPGSDRNGGAAAASGAPTGAAADTYVRSDTGQPVPNPQPGPNGNMIDPRDGAPLITLQQFQQRSGGGGLPSIPGLPQIPGLPLGGANPLVPSGLGSVVVPR
jgi:general secretion pathway protein I